jgi:hypothetical protein
MQERMGRRTYEVLKLAMFLIWQILFLAILGLILLWKGKWTQLRIIQNKNRRRLK